MVNQSKEKILVTGCAGFIGMHLCNSLSKSEFDVMGIDNLNDYYDTGLKMKRLKILERNKNFKFKKSDITNKKSLNNIFKDFMPNKVVNLAAQAGVRASILNPRSYIDSNIVGFLNILESCKDNNISLLVYASSSSVYGQNSKMPFSEEDRTDNPVSLYATSKKSNELMAKTYNKIYNLKSVGLRFFTVYGPWGRPDMAYYKFTKNLINDKPIKVYNHGDMERDFTYIDDIIKGIKSAINFDFNCEIINLGNNNTEKLLDMIHYIEKYTGKKADILFEPMQLGDVKKTYADINKAKNYLNYNPATKLEKGIESFINWYKKYNN